MALYPSQRFGQDSAPRIATTATMLSEASELAPVPTYQSLVSFVPADSSFSSSSTSSTDSTTPQWKVFPDRLDLYAYQGDDIQIPLYFQDPADASPDFATGYAWKGQTRVLHRYWSTLIHQFTINATYVPPVVGPPAVVGHTLVTLFLPRSLNTIIGTYEWDLQSVSPFVGPTYPRPPEIDAADWPPTNQLKTWIFGHFYIVPRVTATDYLPVVPDTALPAGQLVTVTPAGLFGPNGRVP